MARVILSDDIPRMLAAGELDKNHAHFAYNALDSAVTLTVHQRLAERLAAQNSPHARTSYSFVRAMQGPAMDMMLRGIAIQQKVRQDETARYVAIRDKAQATLDTLADAVWGPDEYELTTKRTEVYTPTGKRGQPLTPRTRSVKDVVRAVRPRGLNPGSNPQMLAFFNIALKMSVEYEIRKTPEGSVRTPSANDKALRKWAAYRCKGPGVDPRDRSVEPVCLAAPFVSLILTIRDMDKMLGVLRTPLDPDGRMRCSYNVVGTENGRWSSSKNAFGRGTNLQNISPTMRRMFCADDGYRLISTDLEQAESRVVAGLVWAATGDESYWNACESSDLHTTASMMSYAELQWSNDPAENRELANRPCLDHPHYTIREANKRFGHGCVTPDHEVLTPKGWVNIDQQPPVIMGLNQDKSCAWVAVKHWTKAPFGGSMVRLEGTAIDQLLTPNHRVIFSRDPGGQGALTAMTAAAWDMKGAIPLGFSFAGGDDPLTPELARLVSAIQADGNIRWNGSARFHFHKERKFQRLMQLCEDAGVLYKRLNEHVTVYWIMPYPKDAGPYLLNWSEEALRAYSDEHRYWDGSISKTAICISSKNEEHLEWLQTINRLIGKGGNIQKPRLSGFGTTIYKLQENNRRWAHAASMARTPESYSGFVYCPTVEHGMFLVRRNGRISVTGNSNYEGSDFGIAQQVGVPTHVIRNFQRRYFAAFPGIPEWHKIVKRRLMEDQYLDTPLGRRRYFFGRLDEAKTHREAIAYGPQSTVGEILNYIMWRVWARSLPNDPFKLNCPHLPIQLLLQNHDAFLLQTPESTDLPTLIAEINSEFQNATIPFVRGDEVRNMSIPGEFVTGWNWAYKEKDPDQANWDFVDGNVDGLTKWRGSDSRKRQQGARASLGDWMR